MQPRCKMQNRRFFLTPPLDASTLRPTFASLLIHIYFPLAPFFVSPALPKVIPTHMPLSAEQQRERRAVKRAAEEAAGVFRRRRGGRLAAGHVWDEQTGTAVPQAPQPPASPSAEEGEANKMTPMEANKMTPMERKAKRAADQQRRRAAAQFSMASEDTEKVSEDPEKVIASLLDELVDEVP